MSFSDLPAERWSSMRSTCALHLVGGLRRRQLVLHLVLHVGESAIDGRLDVGDAQQHGGEAALDRIGHGVLGQAEGGVGDLRVDQAILGNEAEVDIGILGASFLGGVGERLAAGNRLLRGLGGRLVLEGDLLHAPALGRVVGVLRVVVGGLRFRVGHAYRLLQFVDREHEQADLAVLGRHERLLVGFIRRLDLRLVRLGHGDGLVRIDGEVLGNACLAAPLIDDVHHAVGHSDAVDQRRGELPAQLIAPAQLQEAALAHAKPIEDVLEGKAVELAVGALEGLIALHRLSERFVRQREAELVGVRLDGRPADELSEDAIVETGGVRLLGGDAASGLLRDLVDLVLEGALILLDADLVVADLGDRAASPAGEHVGYAPNGEAQHEHRKEQLGNPSGGAASQGVEHCGDRPWLVARGAAQGMPCVPKGVLAAREIHAWPGFGRDMKRSRCGFASLPCCRRPQPHFAMLNMDQIS